METGERFDYIGAACEKYGVTHRAIYQVVNGECATCKGLHWQFAEDYDAGLPVRKTSKNNLSPVQQIDMDSGEVVGTYNSIQEAQEKTGANKSAISACCRGKYHTAGGFKWRYAT